MPTYDVDQRYSPAWWMRLLTDQLARELDDHTPVRPNSNLELVPGLHTLGAWLDNMPPLPEGAPDWAPAYQRFHRDTRTAYAEISVSSASDRLNALGFRTAAVDDDDGDQLAADVMAANELAIVQSSVMYNMLGKRNGYVFIGPPPEGERWPVITSEEPEQVSVAVDPLRPNIVRAAIKTYYDPFENKDVCVVYIRGESRGDKAVAYTARRPAFTGAIWRNRYRMASGVQWTWDEPEAMRTRDVPIVVFPNRNGVAEFEPHLGLLSRLNQQVLNRMVIADIQAFRQRGVKGLPKIWPNDPSVPEELRGQVIDYSGIFTPGPGTMWMVPPGAEFWESQPIDIRPLLEAEGKEERTYSALAKIPISYFNPSDANQSAEGATLQREGLIFKVEDRATIAGARWAQVMSFAFQMMNETQRADVTKIETIWAPFERLSLAERFSAGSQAANFLSPASIRRFVLRMTPREMRQAEADDARQRLLQPVVQPPAVNQPQRVPSQRADQAGRPQLDQPGQRPANPPQPPGQRAVGQ